jgi:hypothetical protein
MEKRVCSYFRRGFTMSRRAYISHKKNEHPITHWVKILALDKELIKKMLIYVGIHHTGMYARRTRFYRLPNLKDEKEFRRFYRTFHTIPKTKKKFIDYMSNHLQEMLRERKDHSRKGKPQSGNDSRIPLRQWMNEVK